MHSPSASSRREEVEDAAVAAAALYSRAAEAASAAHAAAVGGAATGCAADVALVAGEALASAHLGAAELAVRAARWDEAEQALGKALKAAEGGRHGGCWEGG